MPPPVPGTSFAGGLSRFSRHAGHRTTSALIGGVPKWQFIGPQATVFDDSGEQILTHFQSTNPVLDAIHATWEHSRDSSVVWGRKLFGSTDPNYVSPDAIEWLLLEVTGTAVGPTGGDKLLPATQIQRVNTVGGKEPATGCSTLSNLTQRQLVPYEADYIFYR